jgi:hypothetical protein
MFKWMAILLFPVCIQGQSLSAASFFKYDTIPALYLGIDFTQAKLIRDDVSKENIIQERQFNGINDLMIKENKKYDFQEAYRRTTWDVDISEVEKRNQLVDPALLKSTNEADLHRMRKPDIDSLVNGFNFGTHRGYGILLIVQGMDKSRNLITVWYTLVDMEAKKVLFTYLLQGGVIGGFGFRNYWSSAIKSTIIYVKNRSYPEWKERFGIK